MSVTQSSVVELRQYTLKPGAADALVGVFEAELVESQEALGMAIGGLFRDRDDADRFVWMRGFDSMESRHEALAAFYGGPVWKRHGPAANATMVDSDDVLLLRPTDPAHRPLEPGPRAAVGAVATGDEWVVVTAWLHEPGHGTCDWLARDVQPLLAKALGTNVATWRTEPAENTFPALPVRPDHAFVWTATFPDHASYAAALASLDAHPDWRRVALDLDSRTVLAETLRLGPTARSSHPPAG
jgi:hypothetical protein